MGDVTVEVVQTRDQLEAWTDVRNEVDPRTAITADEAAFFTSVEPDRVNLLARLDGVAVGAGFAAPLVEEMRAPFGELQPRVLATARRRGVGSALIAVGAAHLRTLGKQQAQAGVNGDDGESLAFAERRGWREVGREQSVVLDLGGWQPDGRRPPPGIELTDLAERTDLLRAMWELDRVVSRDIPGTEDPDPPFHLYERMLDKPGLDPRLFVLALDGERLVGVAMLVPSVARPGLAQHWLTGVHPDWRGRGLASAMKEEQLRRAKAAGLRRARTSNELRNAPMRAVNARLGYVNEPDVVRVRGPLPGPA